MQNIVRRVFDKVRSKFLSHDTTNTLHSTTGENMNSNTTYRAYTGTFTKNNGHKRTMTFIKGIDVPTHIRGGSRTTTLKEGQEVVYDVDAKGFRVFNWGTVQGQVTEKNINFSFDKS